MATHSSTLAWKIHEWRSLVDFCGVAKSWTQLHFHVAAKDVGLYYVKGGENGYHEIISNQSPPIACITQYSRQCPVSYRSNFQASGGFRGASGKRASWNPEGQSRLVLKACVGGDIPGRGQFI